MAKFRIVVVDDQYSARRDLYKNIFSGDADFSVIDCEKWSDFCKLKFSEYDAIILDVNLDDWGVTISEAFARIGSRCPVWLASLRWNQTLTHSHISAALSGAKDVVLAGTIALENLAFPSWEDHAFGIRSQLRIVISRMRHRGLLDLDFDDSIKILHLSDPQYGDPGQDDLAFLAEQEVANFIQNELDVNIHFIVITGDVTFSGQPHEFDLAIERLQKLASRLLPNREDWRERILIVPGNHDVDFSLAAADWIEFSIGSPGTIKPKSRSRGLGHLRYGLQCFRDFAWKLSNNPNWRDADDLIWMNDSFRHLGVRFVMLNSVASVGFDSPKNYMINSDVLSRMVEESPRDESLFGIAISHHGPSVDGNSSVEDLNNWAQIRKSFQQRKIKLLLHGHGHRRIADIVPLSKKGGYRAANGQLGAGEVMRVMAPTTHLDETMRSEGDSRGFNLLTLSRHHGKVESVQVDSYELSDDHPHFADGSPWKVRII